MHSLEPGLLKLHPDRWFENVHDRACSSVRASHEASHLDRPAGNVPHLPPTWLPFLYSGRSYRQDQGWGERDPGCSGGQRTEGSYRGQDKQDKHAPHK